MKTTANIVGVFDTDVGRLVGVAPQGASDVSFVDTYDAPPEGVSVRASTDPVTGGMGFTGAIVDMDETPTDVNTASYPTGTLFISPEA